jgi:hypothetical protein
MNAKEKRLAHRIVLVQVLLDLEGVSVSRLDESKQERSLESTYSPAIGVLETCRSNWAVDLATEEARQATVAVHHCVFRSEGARHQSEKGVFALCLSHWSIECLARFPPF